MVRYAILLKKKKKPEWLDLLLKNKFFVPCADHQDLRKNEVNVFCIDCNRCVCQHCISSSGHSFHNFLQIRRYVYQDVVRLDDMQHHVDCSKIQPYTINGAKVIFLNPRPQNKPSKSNSGASCEICERSLTEPNRYCSISCKISVVTENARDRSPSPFISFRIPEFNDLSAQNLKEEVESSTSGMESSEEKDNLSSVLKPKKRLNKRKGFPRRAPLC